MAVTVDHIRYYLTSRSQVPSPMGSQLEMMRTGVLASRSSSAAKSITLEAADRRESEMLRLAEIGRCVQALADVQTVAFVDVPAVHRLARRSGRAEGAIIVGVLRAYQEWSTRSEERGLSAVHLWLRGQDGADIDDVVQAFRENKGSRARRTALCLVSDGLVALERWVRIWNRGGRDGR